MFNQMTARDGDLTYTRVTKNAARQAWIDGKPVVLCPVKFHPFGGFRPSLMSQRDFEDEKQRLEYGLNIRTFDSLVQDFCWYNANSYETGYYPSYWVAI